MYVPAENAAIPNLVGEGEALMTANAMNSATWSIALAVGASVGGFVVAAYGTDTAFIIDAVSFSLSALFISLLTIPQETKEAEGSIFVKASRKCGRLPPHPQHAARLPHPDRQGPLVHRGRRAGLLPHLGR